MNPDIEFSIEQAKLEIRYHEGAADYQECAYWKGYIDGLKDAERILNE